MDSEAQKRTLARCGHVVRPRLICLLLFSLLSLIACHSSRVARPVTSGLIVTDLVVGSGPVATLGDTLTVRYVGRFTDCTVFDSSAILGRTFTFKLGAGVVIRGWDLGMPGTRVGGTRRLVIPPELAYGARGAPPVIPPNATLVFDVELLDVRSRETAVSSAPGRKRWRVVALRGAEPNTCVGWLREMEALRQALAA